MMIKLILEIEFEILVEKNKNDIYQWRRNLFSLDTLHWSQAATKVQQDARL